jgi:hypothetical protein
MRILDKVSWGIDLGLQQREGCRFAFLGDDRRLEGVLGMVNILQIIFFPSVPKQVQTLESIDTSTQVHRSMAGEQVDTYDSQAPIECEFEVLGHREAFRTRVQRLGSLR